jgi:hypothetical protein
MVLKTIQWYRPNSDEQTYFGVDAYTYDVVGGLKEQQTREMRTVMEWSS